MKISRKIWQNELGYLGGLNTNYRLLVLAWNVDYFCYIWHICELLFTLDKGLDLKWLHMLSLLFQMCFADTLLLNSHSKNNRKCCLVVYRGLGGIEVEGGLVREDTTEKLEEVNIARIK